MTENYSLTDVRTEGSTLKSTWKVNYACTAINGNWGAWSDYTPCSVTCGDGGISTRVRACDKPAPEYGGTYCTGPSSDTIPCSRPACGEYC